MPHVQVRLAVPDDMMTLHGLLGNLRSAASAQESFVNALGEGRSATCIRSLALLPWPLTADGCGGIVLTPTRSHSDSSDGTVEG